MGRDVERSRRDINVMGVSNALVGTGGRRVHPSIIERVVRFREYQ